MLKWFAISLVAVLCVACSTENTDQTEKKEIPVEEVIRIYADTIGWDEKLPCEITYAGKTYNAEIKYRGGISSQYPKHSMTVEFNDQVKLGDLPANDDWIFNANYIDKTFQRHKLSYDIFQAMDRENRSPKCDYLPIFVNDEYVGLYVIMEKVNGSWLGFDKKNPSGARLFKDPFVFVQERLPNIQEPDNYYQQKFPKQKLLDCNHELDAFKKFLFESGDEKFVSEYKNWVDERSLIDWHLLLLLTNNHDGIIKNFYLYKLPNNSRLKFIPWDYDHSFGRDGNYELNLIEREVGWQRVILLKRLMDLTESGYAERLSARFDQLRKEVFTTSYLLNLIDDNSVQIRPHLEKNAKKWPLDGTGYLDPNNYDQEIEIMKEYIPMRLKQLDAFFSNLDYGQEEKN